MTRAAFFLLVALALAPIASAHTGQASPRTHILTAHDAETENGTVAWFTVDDIEQANPTLTVQPGEHLLLVFVNAGDVDHELAIQAPVDRSTGPVSPGTESSLQFEIPENATGTIPYGDPGWSHRGLQASFAVNASEPETQLGLPAPSAPVLLAAVVGLALALSRRR